MEVGWHPEAEAERQEVSDRDLFAIDVAVEKLRVNPLLGYPHTSDVGGGIRELRPRQGRCRWRVFYARHRDTVVVLAIGPEAASDRHGFAQTRQRALARLRALRSNG
ncbi:MAG TPA: type II toxin-antitoxin system RelE/ParE family toxin [Candidatus Dormibacteraeota bacterium]|nr:type II toxin-antitoxin system RelE/ParE family toxin [Candidatus Dormibacteraeota bacterium]